MLYRKTGMEIETFEVEQLYKSYKNMLRSDTGRDKLHKSD